MTTRRSCSWCDTLNVTTGGPVTCERCGHRADVCRLDCDCPKCDRARRAAEAAGLPTRPEHLVAPPDGA